MTGRVGRPGPSVHHVSPTSPVATNRGEKLRFQYLVRFAVRLTGARIGFHTVPRSLGGVPIQSESQPCGAGGTAGWIRHSPTPVVLRPVARRRHRGRAALSPTLGTARSPRAPRLRPPEGP